MSYSIFRLVLAVVLLIAGAAFAAETAVLPPLPAGIAELKFADFYKMPIGPRGLEPTPKLLALGGKPVRVVGYMVREEEAVAGVFMLSPVPVTTAELADGPADDLPANTVYVHMPASDAQHILPYRPGLWVLTGTLDLGAREEMHGRVSYARLILSGAPAPVSGLDSKPQSASAKAGGSKS